MWFVKISEPPKENEKSDKGKKDALGSFYNHPHYLKIYDILKNVFASYKVFLCSDCFKIL